MNDRREYEMTQEQHDRLLSDCQPAPMIALQCGSPPSQQANANAAWAALGNDLGFDYKTVRPVRNKGFRFFTAVATDD